MSEQRTHLPLTGRAAYTNPLPITPHPLKEQLTAEAHPDPYILKYNGHYYAYATGLHGVTILYSADLTVWTDLGYTFKLAGYKGYWAPAVVYENGTFYLYVSAMPEGEEDVHLQRLMVATSAVPEGPYKYEKTLYDTFSIDAHVVKDDSGSYFLFYSNNEYAGVDAERPGTVILVDRLVDMLTPEGKPQLVVAPTLDEEIYEENRFGDGRDWHTIEGAFFLSRGGKHYVMYSGNAYVRPNYFLGYSVAESDPDQSLTQLNWSKHPSEDVYEPLLRKNDGVEGVGHNSVVRGPNNVDAWVFYHGRNAEDELDFAREQRTMRADPLLWRGDEMWVPGPTYALQDAPAMPALRDLFHTVPGPGTSELSSDWQVLGGTWRMDGGSVTQIERSGEMSAIARRKFGSYVMEVSLQWQHDHRGGKYGVYPAYVDERNYAVCLLDVGRRLLQFYLVKNGVKHAVNEQNLPSSLQFDAYHLLTVRKAGASCVIALDGVNMLEGNIPFAEGRIGLLTQFTSASFAGVEVTDHLELSKGVESGFAGQIELTAGDGLCELKGNELYCRSNKGESVWRIAPPAPSAERSHRFAFDLELYGHESAAGFYLFDTSGNAGVKVVLDKRSGTAVVELIRDDETERIGECAVEAGFNWKKRHTMLTVFREGRLYILLDEDLLFDGHAAFHSAIPSLTCCGKTVFRNVQFTGLA